MASSSSTDRGIADSVTTSLTQAYIGHKTDEIKQEFMGLVGMGNTNDSFNDEENQNGSLKSNPNRTLWTSAVFITAAVGLGMNIFAMVVFQATIVYIMGIITALLAGAVVYSELQLEDLPSKFSLGCLFVCL